MPESAAGKTTRVATLRLGRAERVGALAQAVRHRRIASSETEAMIGTIIRPMPGRRRAR